MCPYKDLEKYRKYQREYRKKWYWAHHEEALERCRISREKHRDERRSYQKNRWKEIRKSWRTDPCSSYLEKKQLGIRVEDFAEKEIFPALGFEDVLNLNSISRMFPYDFVATKEGKDVFIEVTSDLVKKVSIRRILAKRLNMDLYVLFVKPDLSKHYLKKVDLLNDQKVVSLTIDVVSQGP